MNADFEDSHNRHWDDAEQLFTSTRWANADHLFGIATECGLKRLMLAFGMSATADGSPSNSVDKKHVDLLWARYESYRSGFAQGANYALPTNNPFQDWSASQRYAHQSNFDEARIEPHRTGASLVRQLVKKASIEGLL